MMSALFKKALIHASSVEKFVGHHQNCRQSDSQMAFHLRCYLLSKTNRFCTFLEIHYIASLLSIVPKEWTANISAICNE